MCYTFLKSGIFKGIDLTIEKFDINKTLEDARKALEKDTTASDSLRAIFEVLLIIIKLMADRLGKNSKNSSKPPAQDPNRKRGSKKDKNSNKKAGGQEGHEGKTLQLSSTPDIIVPLSIDKRTLPKGREYITAPPEIRQVVNIVISKEVTEYQAEVYIDSKSKERFVATFPENVTATIQYGSSVKALLTYFSQWQLIPYERVREIFRDQFDMNISVGTIFNSNQFAYLALDRFETIAQQKLIEEESINCDETGINVNKKNVWIHSASSALWVLLFPHAKRGKEGMDAAGILPHFKGILIHDCWKPYFQYSCLHGLCNAHLLRELIAANEDDKQSWAKVMHDFLIATNKKVEENNGALNQEDYDNCVKIYDWILENAENECPLPEPPKEKKRGKQKKSKTRNLLERMIEHKEAILRFAISHVVPFTNNRAENDIRMTKVQQKISGCFRSFEGAQIFCRIRSYLITCQRNGVSATSAMNLLFEGKLPNFME